MPHLCRLALDGAAASNNPAAVAAAARLDAAAADLADSTAALQQQQEAAAAAGQAASASAAQQQQQQLVQQQQKAAAMAVPQELLPAVESLRRWRCVRGFVVPMLVGMVSCSAATRARMWVGGGLPALLALLGEHQVRGQGQSVVRCRGCG